MTHARAILWAQWRTVRNFYPRAGMALTAVIGVIWYGLWAVASVSAARFLADPKAVERLLPALPSGLLLVMLYWQVVPLLMAATGASLDIRKLRAYPIPVVQLFGIEALLRATAAIEMLAVLVGATVGVILNPALPAWGALGIAGFTAFNLLLAVGLRDLAARVLAYRRVRELLVFLLVLCAGLPQLFVALSRRNAAAGSGPGFFKNTFGGLLSAGENWAGWPWTAASAFVAGRHPLEQAAILAAWCAVGAAFGWWQFTSSLNFDADAAGARLEQSDERTSFLDRLYRLPGALFGDPLAALMEKELRLLARSPRFRLMFMMGFTFGMVIWLPLAMGRRGLTQEFMGQHYLTAVSVYSLLLLSEVCFWNSFGFDRSAAQFYFLAPISFSTVLKAKNLSSVCFIALEIGLITVVCALLGMPLNPAKMSEAYSVAAVMTILLLCAGNLLSVHMARGVNPDSSFRTTAAGRIQAMLFMIYPLAFIPPGLAYLARYAFESQWAFFGVLAFDVMAGLIAYKIALDSAVQASERIKETMLAALARGDGPIAG
jgi:ABC-2 type transport system permease protein